MKKRVLVASLSASLLLSAPAFAAELLDVKPVTSGTEPQIEISADIPMTYTYYSIPGEARAVIDIADADPEKVEPLIVVNKGAVSSISVDKAQISSIIVSRLIFNLVSESSISVTASPDRKKLTVSFTAKGGSQKAAAPTPVIADDEPTVNNAPMTNPPATPEPKKEVASKTEETKPSVATTEAKTTEEDPLGLDEPAPKNPTPSVKVPPAAVTASAAKAAPMAIAASLPNTATKTVPASVTASDPAATVDEVIVSDKEIKIITKSDSASYKTMLLTGPTRLVIDINAKRKIKNASIPIKKFGVEKIRIGEYQGKTRIVLDSVKPESFPQYKVVNEGGAIKVTFK